MSCSNSSSSLNSFSHSSDTSDSVNPVTNVAGTLHAYAIACNQNDETTAEVFREFEAQRLSLYLLRDAAFRVTKTKHRNKPRNK